MINIFCYDILNSLLYFLTIEEIIILEQVNKEIRKNIFRSYNDRRFEYIIKNEYPKIVNYSSPYYLFLKKLYNNANVCLKCNKSLDKDFNMTLIVYVKDNIEIDLHNYHISCIKPLTTRMARYNLQMSTFVCPLTNCIVSGWKSKYI